MSRPTIGLAVLGFGLVHGLGLATRFQDLGIPENGELTRVIAFNVGIEIGQLIAIAILGLVVFLFLEVIEPEHRGRAVQLALVPVFFVGFVAAGLLAQDLFTSEPEAAKAAETGQVALPADSSCEIGSPTEPWGLPGGTHPAKTFYPPEEDAPLADFAHVIGDGYVIVLHSDKAEASQVAELRKYVEAPRQEGVLAAASPDVEGVKVYQSRETMTCGEFEMESVDQFSRRWLDRV